MKRFVEIEADGETYRLRYSVNALCLFEERTGRSAQEIDAYMEDGGLSAARTLVAIGLSDQHGELEPSIVGEIMDAVGLLTIIEKLGEAIEHAFPDVETQTGDDAGNAKAGKG